MDNLKLTESEKLYLWRKRLSITQVDAAIKLGVSVQQIWDWEAGKKDVPMPTINVVAPSEVETCVIKRRRSKMTQGELAKKLKVSRLWVVRMESGLVSGDRLISYWS